MAALAELMCTVCKAGDIPLDDAEIREKLVDLPEWSVKEENGIKKIWRVFKFKDYSAVLDFTKKVGLLAEEQGHHPVLIAEWGKVTVIWWTHKINGLHINDFIMAAKTENLFTD